jgi:hypothetical protein
MAKKTDAQITEDHFRGLPMFLDLMKPTDIVEFADRVDGEMFLVKSAIMSLHRLGYIQRRTEDGVYYWPLTMRHNNACKVAA